MAVCALLTLVFVPRLAPAAGIEGLRAKLDAGRQEASRLAAELQSTQGRLASAEQRAAAATAREEKLSRLLTTGERRAAVLARKVETSERRLALAKARLRRARGILAQRLVAIYESGAPSTAGVLLAAGDLDELATRSEYLRWVQESDSVLAARVEQVREAVQRQLEQVESLKARVDAYNQRLAAARSQIAAVRSAAEAAASELESIAASRRATMATLKADIGKWVREIEAAEQASREAAEETVGRWLGGPYSIPTYIVMCESGGNYGAVNPSSGAGGAYQILPSTWALYGGTGDPEDAPKAEQDAIAAEIWADSGPGAWVCG